MAKLKSDVVDLKERLKQLKKDKATESSQLFTVEQQIADKERIAREQEAQAAAIDAAVFDLKAVNPNAVVKVDNRSTSQILKSIEAQGRLVIEALGRLRALLPNEEG